MFENISCNHKKTTEYEKPLTSNTQTIKDVVLFAMVVILCLVYYMDYSKQDRSQQYLNKGNKKCNCVNKAKAVATVNK